MKGKKEKQKETEQKKYKNLKTEKNRKIKQKEQIIITENDGKRIKIRHRAF